MTSREIADLTGKEHFNVKRDIRSMLDELGIDALSFEGMSQDAYGRPLEIFALPKDLTITLVSGYSVVMRHRIVTRWMELEASRGQPVGPGKARYHAPWRPFKTMGSTGVKSLPAGPLQSAWVLTFIHHNKSR